METLYRFVEIPYESAHTLPARGTGPRPSQDGTAASCAPPPACIKVVSIVSLKTEIPVLHHKIIQGIATQKAGALSDNNFHLARGARTGLKGTRIPELLLMEEW